MLKQKKYNIADSNIANFGSELDHNVKKASAETEPAWKNAGKTPGIEIWRIEQFKVISVPKNTYGTFYSGDSYIVLKTYKNKDIFAWDVHFWLGEFTTQDEAGTAAYKTVELDELLGGAPVQYREVDGHESDRFLSYFTPPGLRILQGGVATGFHHVKPEEYKPRLLHVKGRGSNVRVTEVALSHTSLNSGDVFILDAGLSIYQWNGKSGGPAEKNKGSALARAIKDEREGRSKVTVHEEGDKDLGEFWKILGGEGPVKSAAEGGSDTEVASTSKVLFSLSDATGKLEFKKVAESKVTRAHFVSNDAFIFDVGPQVFAWIGKGSSANERKGALQYAADYLKNNSRPLHLPIIRILEGGENEVFEAFLDK